MLVKNSVRINSTEEEAWAAIHFAAAYGHDAVVRLLIERSVDVNARTLGDRDNFWFSMFFEIAKKIH